jgi:hypothetical protein
MATAAETRAILTAAAERVRALLIREPIDDTEHAINAAIDTAARAVLDGGDR